MRELTLLELQSICLEILIDIDDFCTKNNIRYSLAHGTLIGAIRHKGFIPWDDDLDINMPRPDYEKFKNSYKSDRFEFFCYEKKNAYLSFGRVCDTKRTFAKSTVPWTPIESGVWVDIFPLDGIEDSKLTRKSKLKILGFLYELQLVVRKSHYRIPKRITFTKKFHHFLKIIIAGTININHLVALQMYLCKRVPFGKNNKWAHLTCEADDNKMVNKLEDYQEIIRTEFEGHQFCIMNGYDHVLRNEYGDYMQLPPEEQRIPQQNYIKFYWK